MEGIPIRGGFKFSTLQGRDDGDSVKGWKYFPLIFP